MNIKVIGNTATIATTITPEEFRKVKKLKPDLLIVKNEKGEPVFRLDATMSGKGNINSCGAEFVPGVDDTLVITIGLEPGITVGEAKEALFSLTAAANPYVEKIEALVAENIDSIRADEQAYLDSIQVG